MTFIPPLLTVIGGTDHPPRVRRVAAEQTNWLSIRRQLPLLSRVQLLILLIPRQLREHVVHYARLLLQVRIGLHFASQVLDVLHGEGLLKDGVPDDAHPPLDE